MGIVWNLKFSLTKNERKCGKIDKRSKQHIYYIQNILRKISLISFSVFSDLALDAGYFHLLSQAGLVVSYHRNRLNVLLVCRM